ncbi:glycine--tRNA ligase [Candidatus Woesearchaeota archaeon]|nr:glycine--tRNA ligase [Candidatus Woesearchaeota archaeon]
MAHTAQDLATFCKKKGFMYPSSEIYGGLAGFYDYGHLGTLLKRKFEQSWRDYFLGLDRNYVEIDTAQIMPEAVFKASGHLENFSDPTVHCSRCDFSDRADHLIQRAIKQRVEGLSPPEMTSLIEQRKLKCPKCAAALRPVTAFNMMFPVSLGVGTTQRAFLRPETAQSPYVNFKLQHELQRKKMPLGLALIGKAFRNEISPRNLTLRLREFTQAELQIFFNPRLISKHPSFASVKNYKLRVLLEEDRQKGLPAERTAADLVKRGLPEFYVYHLVVIQKFYFEVLKIAPSAFRFYQLDDKEKAFYNKYHFDVEVELADHGFTELGGLHYRTDHDLGGHHKISKQNLEVLDEESGEKYLPHVLELSFGVDRNVYALLDVAFDDHKQRGNIVLHLPPSLTPYLCAVFPLVKNKEELVAKAEEVDALLQKHQFRPLYDEVASIGRRYARADEIGVKYCLTVDFESLSDGAVTVRDRETTEQKRVPIAHLSEYLRTSQ